MRLVYIALAWVIGIVLASSNQSGAFFLPIIWLVLVALATLTLWLMWQDRQQRFLIITLLAFTLGGLRATLTHNASDIMRYNNSGGLTIEGVIIAEPDIRDDRTQLRLQVETVTSASQTLVTNGVVLVETPRTEQINYGDRIRATGILITPAEYDTFSYADFLAREGVFSIMRFAAIEVTDHNQANPIYAALLNAKATAQNIINHNLPEPQAGLLSGILLGNERGISPEVSDAFARVGASHVIAISGFNMVILSGVILKLLGGLPFKRRWQVVIAIAIIGAYTIFVGANAAVIRAAVMSSVLIIGQSLRRKTYVPATLAFVAIMMTALTPTVLWDISFQLSFFATLGLALYVDPLSRQFRRFLDWFLPPNLVDITTSFLAEPLIVTIAAQITTLPLIVLYFGRLSSVSIIINLLIIPPQAALLIIGVLATLAAFIVPVIGQILYWLDFILLSWTISLVRLFSRLSFADVDFKVDARLITLYFIVLLGAAMLQATQPTWAIRLGHFLRRRAVVTATLFAGGLIVTLSVIIFLSRPDGRFNLWLLDAGHSNAILMQTPSGAQILVDGGRFPSRLLTMIGDRIPFYDRELEVVVITQPDVFEYGALPAVLSRYSAGTVLTNGQPNLGETYAELQSALSAYPVVNVRAGYTLTTDDGVTLEVLHPQGLPDLNSSMDDETLVLRVRYGDVSFLLTSDLSATAQRALMDAGEWPLASVLQIPQHGGSRSLNSEFLAAVQPQVVLLQSDAANQRGDPEPDTLNLLGDTPIYRTDEQGTIHMWSDGQNLWVEE